MKLSENPTPEEVRDFYDLHTAEGAANFSHTGGGFAVQLWHSLAWALEDKAQLEAENDVLRNTISLLKNENERMMKLAHDYITAYEKLAFGEEQGDETE